LDNRSTPSLRSLAVGRRYVIKVKLGIEVGGKRIEQGAEQGVESGVREMGSASVL
jgi:hypothetical protein